MWNEAVGRLRKKPRKIQIRVGKQMDENTHRKFVAVLGTQQCVKCCHPFEGIYCLLFQTDCEHGTALASVSISSKIWTVPR
jgi:hypothetical protein